MAGWRQFSRIRAILRSGLLAFRRRVGVMSAYRGIVRGEREQKKEGSVSAVSFSSPRCGPWATVPALLLAGVIAEDAHAQCTYQVDIIQAPDCPFPLEEPPPTLGTGLNELGHVVGYYSQCDDPTLREAFVWKPETGMVTVQRPAGVLGAVAADVNDVGQVIGTAEISAVGRRGFLIDAGVFIDLGTLPGGNFSEARAVNELGQVTGFWGNFVNGDPSAQAFLWQDDVMTDLGPTIGGVASRAFGLNDSGQVTGWRRENDGDERIAFIWQDGINSDLGPIPGGFSSEGLAINSRGEVTGAGLLRDAGGSGTITRAFLHFKGQMTDLGTLPGFPRSAGIDINDVGIIVGLGFGVNPPTGFVCQTGTMIDLNDLIASNANVIITNATAINNAGQIAGWGIGPDGHSVAVILTPMNSPPTDLTGDCHTGVDDLIVLLGDFGQTGSPADINDDGVVNVLDLIILLLNFGS